MRAYNAGAPASRASRSRSATAARCRGRRATSRSPASSGCRMRAAAAAPASSSHRRARRRCASRCRSTARRRASPSALPARRRARRRSARSPAGAIAREALFWSPVLSGDTATIEISADPDVALDALVLHVPRVSHVLADGADLRTPAAPVLKATGIGAAGSCNTDVACVASTNAAAASFEKSVAKLTFVNDAGRAFVCTGTLIADSVQSQTPYLFAAEPLPRFRGIARTLNTYWFYAATTCGVNATPPYVLLTGGATLLARSPDHDWSLRAPRRHAAGGVPVRGVAGGGARHRRRHRDGPPSGRRPRQVQRGQGHRRLPARRRRRERELHGGGVEQGRHRGRLAAAARS